MVRTLVVAFCCSLLAAVPAVAQTDPGVLLDRGLASWHADDPAAAATHLEGAVESFLSTERLDDYLETGRLENARSLALSLVYLALAYSRTGQPQLAREAIERLLVVERIAPVYVALPLGNDAAEFERLAAALIPDSRLPTNVHAAIDDPTAPLAPVVPRAEPVVRSAAEERAARVANVGSLGLRPAPLAPVTALPPPPPQLVQAPPPPAPEPDRPSIDEIQSAADSRVAAERSAAAQRIAEAEAAAERRIAAIEAEAERRIAAERAESERAIAARVRELERDMEARLAARAVPPPQPVAAALPQTATTAEHLTALRRADALSLHGLTRDANEIYEELARDPRASREVVVATAIGLYRTGSYAASTAAFRRLGTFLRGEEDIRYYYSVALYETGRIEEARFELSCAIPFIELTDEVNRYAARIAPTQVTP